MSVEAVLNKITAHNTEVVGCVAKHGQDVYQNLPELYDLIDTKEITDYAENMFALTEGLDMEDEAFDQLFLEYNDHSIFARKLDEGVLLLLNRPMERVHFKKMQLGVNLFIKPLKRALSDTEPHEPDPSDSRAIRRTSRKRWF